MDQLLATINDSVFFQNVTRANVYRSTFRKGALCRAIECNISTETRVGYNITTCLIHVPAIYRFWLYLSIHTPYCLRIVALSPIGCPDKRIDTGMPSAFLLPCRYLLVVRCRCNASKIPGGRVTNIS